MENIENYINEAGKGTFGAGSGSAMGSKSVLVMLSILLVPVSGCMESGDGPQVEITSEDLQYLFEENFDDFVNNTTITVNQDVNYYNNTSIQQPSTLKSSSGTVPGIESTNNYASGMGMIVREDRFAAATSGNSAAGLDGANICVGIGTLLENQVQQWFSNHSIDFTSIPIADNAEGTAKFIDGSCDALSLNTPGEAEQLKLQLDTDGSMGGVEVWVTILATGAPGQLSTVGNSISLVITQSSEEIISLYSVFVTVDLIGTCNSENANSTDCSNFSVQTNRYIGGSLGADTFTEVVTTCDHGISFDWSSTSSGAFQHPLLYYASEFDDIAPVGINCTFSLNFGVSFSINELQDVEWDHGYKPATHDLSWDEWTYSVVWYSTPIESTN